MLKNKRLSYARLVVLLGAIIGTGFAAVAPSVAEAKNGLVGSWEAADDNSPAIFVVTFNFGGTVSAAYPDANTSNSGGNWEKTGPSEYRATEIAFTYDFNGDVEFRQKTKALITASSDRQTFSAALEIDIINFNGNIVQTINTTASGVRIPIESF